MKLSVKPTPHLRVEQGAHLPWNAQTRLQTGQKSGPPLISSSRRNISDIPVGRQFIQLGQNLSREDFAEAENHLWELIALLKVQVALYL